PVAVGTGDEPAGQVVRALDPVVEGEHGEAVAPGERVDDPGGRAPGGDHLPPGHAAGAVEDEDDVTRAGRGGTGWREHGQLVRALVAVGVRYQYERVDRLRRRVPQSQDEVPVEPLPRPDLVPTVLSGHQREAGAC